MLDLFMQQHWGELQAAIQEFRDFVKDAHAVVKEVKKEMDEDRAQQERRENPEAANQGGGA